MRTTIRLPDALYREVQERSLQNGRTVTSFIEQALREALVRQDAAIGRVDFKVDPFEGTGLQPGIDLTNSAELLDAMER